MRRKCFQTLSWIIPGFHDSERKKGLFKTLWEKMKMLKTNIFSSSHNVFFTLSEKYCTILAPFELSSANALNLDKANILSSGKVLEADSYFGQLHCQEQIPSEWTSLKFLAQVRS